MFSRSRLFPTGRFLSGFTLTELLVCIAIIGILAGLVLAGISQISSRAKNARCLTAIRSWAMAAPLYAAEHQGFLPQSRWDNTSNGEAAIHLAPYVGASSSWSNTSQFTYRNKIMCTSEGWSYGFNRYVSEMKLMAVNSSIIYVMDLAAGGRWIDPSVLTPAATHPDQFRNAFPRPHGSKVSVAFLDGHAELRTVPSLLMKEFTLDTIYYKPIDATTQVMTEAQEAAAQAASSK